MKRNFMLSFNLIIFCALLAFATQAHALLITPDSPTPILKGDQTSQSVIDVFIAGTIGSAKELYKAEVDDGEVTTLALWDSYETVFSDTPTDPSAATITWTGPGIVDSPAFLLVKDGNHSPAWYLFDLTAELWDGMETLYLTDFWPKQGAISHVTLLGDTQPVPEPATMFLFGVGLAGLAGFRRKFKK